MMKNECCEHAIFFNILPINIKFSTKKICRFQFHEIALKRNQLAFQNFFRINKILKIDVVTSILMGDYGVKLTIFLISS